MTASPEKLVPQKWLPLSFSFQGHDSACTRIWPHLLALALLYHSCTVALRIPIRDRGLPQRFPGGPGEMPRRPRASIHTHPRAPPTCLCACALEGDFGFSVE